MSRDKGLTQVKSAAFIGMEDVLEKLRWLDYEKHFVYGLRQRRIGKYEFIVSAKNTGQQFNLYIQLLKWLISHMNETVKSSNKDHGQVEEGEGHDTAAIISEFQKVDIFDDPNLIAQKLMLVLRCLEYDIEFPITKLKQPYGEEAISILNFLADRALDHTNFEHQKPQYVTLDKLQRDDFDVKDQQDTQDLISTDDETFEDSNDSIDLSYDITNVHDDGNNTTFSQKKKSISKKNHEGQLEVTSKVDIDQWKAELERVSPTLEVVFEDDKFITSTQNDWRTIVSNTVKDHQNVSLEIERSRDAFERLSKESNRSLELIQAKEQTVNEKFKHIVDEYAMEHQKVEQLKQTHDQSSKLVHELREELSSVTRKVEEVKAKVDKKGNRMTDTSPLIQIKTTLKEMKVEIREYDLQIGILEHNLLQRRLHASSNRVQI